MITLEKHPHYTICIGNAYAFEPRFVQLDEDTTEQEEIVSVFDVSRSSSQLPGEELEIQPNENELAEDSLEPGIGHHAVCANSKWHISWLL